VPAAVFDKLKEKAPFTYLCVLVCWAFNAYVEIGHYFVSGTLFARVLDGRPYVNDFVLYYLAAKLAERGSAVNIYDLGIQDETVRQIVAPVVPELNFYMQYPPYFFSAVRPLAVLSIGAAFIAWVLTWIFVTTISLWFLVKESIASVFGRIFAISAVLASYPCWLMVELGNGSLFQLPGTIGYFLLLRREKPFLSGLVSGILLVKLQYVPIYLLCGLIIGRWRYAAGVATSACALSLLALVTLGWNNLAVYPHALLFAETSDKVSGVSVYSMQNVRGELLLLFGKETGFAHVIIVAAYALSALVIATLWIKLYPRLAAVYSREESFNYCAGFTVLLMLCTSPHTHVHDFVMAAISAIFFYPLCQSTTPSLVQKALKFSILSAPLLSWITLITQVVFFYARIEPYLLWSIIVLALTSVQIRRQFVAASHVT
jgi:Glycosyltransferase family 87